MTAQRPTRLPPANIDHIDVPVTSYPARALWRIHDCDKRAVFFSLNYDHRFTHSSATCAVMYLGESLTTCIWERFGDQTLNPGSPISHSIWKSRSVSQVIVPTLRLCDLTKESTRAAARVDLSALTLPELSVPQAWGLALQKHPAGFDGLRYVSRFDGRPCVALFARPNLMNHLTENLVEELAKLPEAAAFLANYQIALI